MIWYHLEKKYKTKNPAETINNIRKILYKNRITVTEDNWKANNYWLTNGVPGLFSVSLKLHPGSFSVNGKGVSEQYALASACAEMLERIQNVDPINLFLNRGNQQELKLVPSDAKKLNAYHMIENLPDVAAAIFGGNLDDNKLTDFLKNLDVNCVPYYCLNHSKEEYLPIEILSECVGSNGMCAGNSCEEALIHGLCEIFERVSLRSLYFKNLSFPVIPEHIYRNFSSWKYVEIFRKMGFEIDIRDCSTQDIVPVVGVFITKDGKADFCLGSSPDHEIALERCFTEIMQGRDMDSFEDLLIPIIDDSSKEMDAHEKTEQYFKSLSSYSGALPKSFFQKNEVNQKFQLRKSFDLCGKETLKNILNKLIDNNYKVFIRETSYLDFPVYHVYIPRFSEILQVDYNHLDLKYSNLPKARNIFYSIHNSSKEEIIYLINTIKKMQCSPYYHRDILTRIHNLNLKKRTILTISVIENILVFLYSFIGDYKAAYNTQLEYLKGILPEDEIISTSNKRALPNICLLKLLELLAGGKEPPEACSLLGKSFSADMLKELGNLIKYPSYMKKYFNIPDCISCSSCDVSNNCSSSEVSILYSKLQKIINGYDFSQDHLGSLMDEEDRI